MLFRSIVDRGIGRRRLNDQCPRYPLTSLLEGFQCARHDEYISHGKYGVAVPPFGLEFSSVRGMQNVLAVANEEGIVRLYNTENRTNQILKEWMAHENAVFDIAWVPGDARLVTASGDQMAKMWDLKSGELLGTFKGHQCSVKSVAFTKEEKAVFCTGGRDGNIMVWDTRCSKKDGFYRQVKQISGAHNTADKITPKKQTKKRRPFVNSIAPSVDSQQSVTVVLFRDEHTLISAGAVDGIIKVWDLRKNYTVHHYDPVPMQTYPYPGSSKRKLGYSGLVLDSTGSNLLSNCTDDNIYMFNVAGLKTTPVSFFSGHLNASFYVKSTISPDDQFLASGSSDQHTYIWKISEPERPPVLLKGHSQEVTSIAWCPTDFSKLVSCSDDNTVRIWRMDRGMDGARSSLGEANLVGWACPGIPLVSKTSRQQNTPAKSTLSESAGALASPQPALASPQPAACAPSVAALPLSSSTTSPARTHGAKANTSHHQRTPSSIKRWFTPTTPESPAEPASPMLREVLSPVRISPLSERRVKRRLETGSGAAASCDGAERCDCVALLDPPAKRSRLLVDACCPAQDQHHDVDPAETDDDHRQSPSRQGGKENCSPGAVDWLSVLGQRLRKGQGSPRSSRGASTSRSPCVSKKQEGSRTPSSPTIHSPQSMKKISSYFHRRTLE